ncbi:13500_t:CDS:2 [Funneliformis geosporum]|uniref:17497_t:CDS:1 n=1 Tax=Funneliformis geosporum TaxID=1117311 RepID=A0A9W4SJS8_9GLOM|nr:17497_t:CDS:2 [Funneliformis geosporum]CAI2170651.1 13500_t:CDS:2 [Funneliformis geosporum]
MTIIAFISQKGGVGKSTLTQALAVEAKKKKISVLLADCDSQQATNYDLIIIDGPARTSTGTLEIAKKADLLIQPTGASRADLIPAVKEFHALVKAGINKKKLLFILNHIGSKAEAEIAQEYLKDTGYASLPIALLEKVSFRQIQNEGKSITEINFKTLRKQTKALIENILEYI